MNTSTQTLKVVFVALVSAIFAGSAPAQNRIPQFKDYAVSEVYIGKTAPLVLTRDDRTFKTRLTSAAKNQKPNFAGHYILTSWGCGTTCLMGAIIDAKTGKVYWWNFSICCWSPDVDQKFQPIEFRLNSKLIVFSGARNEKDGDIGAHFYKFENGRFVLVRSVLKENQNHQ
ncbi:MAG: hypothetical protein ND895_03895 [Pyrinomonadaceae bacterium]|nr:hypothetical protein [Pyrinomonadaceae bacterium]